MANNFISINTKIFKHALVLLFVSLMSFMVTYGQDLPDEDGEIEDAEVVIEKNKKITLPKATRNYQKVPAPPVNTNNAPVKFSFENYELELPDLKPRIRILTVKEPELQKLYGNYVKVGFGNYITPYLEGFFNNKRSVDYNYGLHFRHLSSRRGAVDKTNSGSGETKVGVNGEYLTDQLVFTGQIDYENDKHHFYGYSSGEDVDREDIEQIFNRAGINLGVRNNAPDAPLSLGLGLAFRGVSDKFDAKENQFKVTFDGGYEISDLLDFELDAEIFVSKREDITSIDRNMFRLKPAFKFSVDDFDIVAGINLVSENDTIDNADKLHFYPFGKAEYVIADRVKVYAGIGGDIQRVTFDQLSQENPFLAPNVAVNHTNRSFMFFGGLDGQLVDKLTFATGFSIGNYKNLYFFANSAQDSTKFDVLYDTGNTNILNFFGELAYQEKNRFRSALRFDYFGYDTDKVAEAWQRPKYKLDLNASYNLFDKILFDANLYLMGGVKALNLASDTTTELDPIANLSLKTDYLLSNRASVFLQLNNIFGTKYEKYLNYPNRGFMAIAGVSYSF